MSRAFVKEVDSEIDDLPDRLVSPHPNFVTAEGLAAIERILSRFEAANKAAVAKNDWTAIAATQRELRYWNARRSSAQVGARSWLRLCEDGSICRYPVANTF
jgi:hypothetical protein